MPAVTVIAAGRVAPTLCAMDATEDRGARFSTTRWSVVRRAGGDDASGRAALAWLCERYWEPILAHLRRRGVALQDVEDGAQDFLVQVLAGGVVERADPARGRFRSFLLTCLDHHQAKLRAATVAGKRDRRRLAPLDADAAAGDLAPVAGDFDRDWAEALLQRVHGRLRVACAGDGQEERYDLLAPFLTTTGDAAAYAAVGARLGLGESAIKVAVHRLRTRFAAITRAEVAETLADPTPAEIDAEIGVLIAALRGRSPGTTS